MGSSVFVPLEQFHDSSHVQLAQTLPDGFAKDISDRSDCGRVLLPSRGMNRIAEILFDEFDWKLRSERPAQHGGRDTSGNRTPDRSMTFALLRRGLHFVLVLVRQYHGSARFCESLGGCEAESGRCAGYQRNFVFKCDVHSFSALLVKCNKSWLAIDQLLVCRGVTIALDLDCG